MADRGQRLRTWVEDDGGWHLESVERPRRWGWYPMVCRAATDPPAFNRAAAPLGGVERTIAWIGRRPPLESRWNEYLPESRETMLSLAMSRPEAASAPLAKGAVFLACPVHYHDRALEGSATGFLNSL